jgi:4a-hydroxytetrahydrobiopterin dehydratase
MPFWRAVLGYEYRADSPDEDLIDPRGRGPAFWFEVDVATCMEHG